MVLLKRILVLNIMKRIYTSNKQSVDIYELRTKLETSRSHVQWLIKLFGGGGGRGGEGTCQLLLIM